MHEGYVFPSQNFLRIVTRYGTVGLFSLYKHMLEFASLFRISLHTIYFSIRIRSKLVWKVWSMDQRLLDFHGFLERGKMVLFL